MDSPTQTPIDNPSGKEWFAEGYEPPKQVPSNVIYRCFGPPLPASAGESDDDPKDAGSPNSPA